MENLFSSFSHPDSIAFLLSVLVSFLIGFVTAWILWGSRAARYRRELKKSKQDNEALQAELASLKEQLDLKEADLVKAQREAQEALDRSLSSDAEKAAWQADLDAATEETANTQAIARSYLVAIEDLNNQILGLKTRISQQTKETQKEDEAITQVVQMQSSYNATLDRLGSLEEKIAKLAAENAALRSGDETDKRLTSLEAKLNELDTENEALKAELDNLKNQQTFEMAPSRTIMAQDDIPIDTAKSAANAATDEVLAAIGTKIPSASADKKNDLTMIKGIGSFIEKKLNRLGIYTYEQIGSFDKDMIEKITAAIEFFPGRIERDDWVGQASRLAQIQKDYPDALLPSAVFPKNPQDLKIIEGIGPKIERLLKKAGIKTLQELAAAKEKHLRQILEEAGDAYRIHDPSTWPTQADLATKGEWGKLKEYQDLLIGGRDKV